MGVITREALFAPRRAFTLKGMKNQVMARETAREVQGTAGARSVEAVHHSTTFHWVGNGFHVSTYFPSEQVPAERVSPFVLMDYGPPKSFAPLARGKRGVGWHPHRGFETVTLAWEGAVAHRDNAGNAGVIGPGAFFFDVPAGEREEHVVQGRLSHLDVVHEHPRGVERSHDQGRQPRRRVHAGAQLPPVAAHRRPRLRRARWWCPHSAQA